MFHPLSHKVLLQEPPERGGRSLPMTLADAMSLEAKAKDPRKFEDALQRVTGIRVSAPPEAIIGEPQTPTSLITYGLKMASLFT